MPSGAWLQEGDKMRRAGISTALGLIFALLPGMVSTSVANEPAYPPVIECPTAGNRIQIAVSRLDNRNKLLIPLSRGCPFPKLDLDTDSNSWKKALKESGGDFIDRDFLDKNRVTLLPGGIIMGGVAKQLWAKTPLAAPANDSYNEVQTTVDVPTMVQISDLPSKVTANFFYYTLSGDRRAMGKESVTASGSVNVPPVTIRSIGGLVTIQVTAGNVTRFVTLRATKNK